MKTINGQILKQMIISGANNLFNNYPSIDALNVFPVPDGDTGTNMNLTITSGAKEVMNLSGDNIYEIAKAFSKGLLMGARGNSGVILSQIFRGFSQALEGKKEINVIEFAEAFKNSKEVAYKAVLRPVEGTILTVIRESTQALYDERESFSTFLEAMDYLLKEAKASLKRTPDLLPVLKEVGVVDSGGAGLVKILDGFYSALNGKIIERQTGTALEEKSESDSGIFSAAAQMENSEFGYCTEFILDLESSDKKVFNEKRFITSLSGQGNSLVVVRDENLVKVHIHTLFPGSILTFAQQYGEFVTMKIENMQQQHSNLQQERKNYALIAVSAGKGIEDYFKKLRVDKIVSGGQTMNPATEDFIAAIKSVHANNVFIFPNNSNIIMAANQAAQVVEDCKVHVIPTRTIPQGLLSCMLFNPESDVETNVEEMTNGIGQVKSGQVTFSIKDTKINDIEIKANQFIGIEEKNIISCTDNVYDTSIKLLEHMIDDDDALLTIIYGEGVSKKEVERLKAYVADHFPVDVEVYQGDQPVYSYIFGVE